jgi:uncharacterized integral membrane protein
VQIFLLIAALIAVLAVIFALQNAVPITVSFLFWQVKSSLALILIVAFIAGLITSFLFNILSNIKRNRATASQEKEIEETKKEVTTVQEKENE